MSVTAPEVQGALRYEYEPHPKQAEAHRIVVDELLFGGSAGGGKVAGHVQRP